MTEKLPLFPLSTVLFPGARLTLHIFEARYRLMIERCMEEQVGFGVALIRDGVEVGDQGVVPYSIGTVAEITESVRLEDGRYYIAAVGGQRFRIQYPIQRQPYMLAAVAMLPDDQNTYLATAADALRDVYTRYWEVMAHATGTGEGAEELAPDPLALSFQVADLLQVPNPRKQRWLEVDALTRLREVAEALRQELSLLPKPFSGGIGFSPSSFGQLN